MDPSPLNDMLPSFETDNNERVLIMFYLEMAFKVMRKQMKRIKSLAEDFLLEQTLRKIVFITNAKSNAVETSSVKG